ncbi:hypothetical protein Tco_0557791, partial [Tanacetum coccineum]
HSYSGLFLDDNHSTDRYFLTSTDLTRDEELEEAAVFQ